MSRAFVKEENEAFTGEELPERPVSSEPNYVTPAGRESLRPDAGDRQNSPRLLAGQNQRH